MTHPLGEEEGGGCSHVWGMGGAPLQQPWRACLRPPVKGTRVFLRGRGRGRGPGQGRPSSSSGCWGHRAPCCLPSFPAGPPPDWGPGYGLEPTPLEPQTCPLANGEAGPPSPQPFPEVGVQGWRHRLPGAVSGRAGPGRWPAPGGQPNPHVPKLTARPPPPRIHPPRLHPSPSGAPGPGPSSPPPPSCALEVGPGPHRWWRPHLPGWCLKILKLIL